ncbi:MAG: DUF2520 domain-containing protein [Acidimicrobiales bacterium]|nr:DUF2520 domain-containing protein [Acidimicrobiales bacterium]
MMEALRVRLIGNGRAGGALALALSSLGYVVEGPLDRNYPRSSAKGVDVLVLSVPDSCVVKVAQNIYPEDSTLIMHLSGSLTLSALEPHLRKASLHPLCALPSPEIGAERLLSGVAMAVSGDPQVLSIAKSLKGNAFEVSDEFRTLYHAGATIAANHSVALMAQVAKIAEIVGVPRSVYFDLARNSINDVEAIGAEESITGPAVRGDFETIAAHLEAIGSISDLSCQMYQVLSEYAARLRPLEEPLDNVVKIHKRSGSDSHHERMDEISHAKGQICG